MVQASGGTGRPTHHHSTGDETMRTLLTLTVFFLTLGTGYSLASGAAAPAEVSRDQWLSQDRIDAELRKQGYEVRKVKAEKRYYEVYAIDPDGRRIEAHVDPLSGEILKVEEDD
jgi:hypothetical protein